MRLVFGNLQYPFNVVHQPFVAAAAERGRGRRVIARLVQSILPAILLVRSQGPLHDQVKVAALLKDGHGVAFGRLADDATVVFLRRFLCFVDGVSTGRTGIFLGQPLGDAVRMMQVATRQLADEIAHGILFHAHDALVVELVVAGKAKGTFVILVAEASQSHVEETMLVTAASFGKLVVMLLLCSFPDGRCLDLSDGHGDSIVVGVSFE